MKTRKKLNAAERAWPDVIRILAALGVWRILPEIRDDIFKDWTKTEARVDTLAREYLRRLVENVADVPMPDVGIVARRYHD